MIRIVTLALFLSSLTAPTTVFASEHLGRASYGEAMRWYLQAAEAGNAQAQFLLGLKYETGTDVTRNPGKAADWFEKAARQGILEAQFKLAALLERGKGRAADPDGAARWYERAARKGYAPAQYNLAVMRLNAASNDNERIDGLVWLMKACDQDFEPAAKFISRIGALWPAEVIAAAVVRNAGVPAAGGKLKR